MQQEISIAIALNAAAPNNINAWGDIRDTMYASIRAEHPEVDPVTAFSIQNPNPMSYLHPPISVNLLLFHNR